MIFRPVSLVNLVSGRVNGIEGVHSNAALETSPGFLPDQTLHLYLVDQVFGALMQVAKTINSFSGKIGFSRHERSVLFFFSQFISHGY